MRALPSTRLLPPTIALMGALLATKSVALVRSVVSGPPAPQATMIATAQAAGHGPSKPAEKSAEKPAKPADAKHGATKDEAAKARSRTAGEVFLEAGIDAPAMSLRVGRVRLSAIHRQACRAHHLLEKNDHLSLGRKGDEATL